MRGSSASFRVDEGFAERCRPWSGRTGEVEGRQSSEHNHEQTSTPR